MSLSARLAAKEFAREIMGKLEDVPIQDTPHLIAVLEEAAVFEEPVKDLEIGLNQVGELYNITIKGYKNMLDIVRWANTFLGTKRNPALCNVVHTFVQPDADCIVMVIQMEKVRFKRTEKEDRHVDKDPYPLTKSKKRTH
jgi:hypothetical protein